MVIKSPMVFRLTQGDKFLLWADSNKEIMLMSCMMCVNKLDFEAMEKYLFLFSWLSSAFFFSLWCFITDKDKNSQQQVALVNNYLQKLFL